MEEAGSSETLAPIYKAAWFTFQKTSSEYISYQHGIHDQKSE
jgi:hypothetical protein